jgi:hypothetical protein
MTSLGIETATFWLVAYCLNQLCELKKKMWKEAVTTYFNVVSEHSRGWIDENSENAKSEYPDPATKIKPKPP